MAKPTAEERFWAKVAEPDGNGCRLWTASVDVGGYGSFKLDGAMRKAHRVAYEWTRGPIPDGLCLDHLCRVRSCVNPDHLEPVTQQENMRRGEMWTRRSAQQRSRTHCLRGHEYTPENTRIRPKGRECRMCSEIARLCRAGRYGG